MAGRRFVGIEQEEEFLEMGKNRILEIENPSKLFSFREKIQGLDNYDGQDLFSVKESQNDYRADDIDFV